MGEIVCFQYNVANLKSGEIIGVHFEPKIENVLPRYFGIGYIIYAVCGWRIKKKNN